MSAVTTAPDVPPPPARSNLLIRIAAAAVLAPLALALAFIGGWLWGLLATLIAVGLFLEWAAIVGATRVAAMTAGVAGLSLAGLAVGTGHVEWAGAASLVTAMAVAAIGPAQRGWLAGGAIYAAIPLLAAVTLRRDAAEGFTAILFVLLLVWATDSGGYFVGRALGGPKLWERVSPKKTWSGAFGGLAGALLVAAGFGFGEDGRLGPLLGIAALLSVASQGGDLFESAVKRQFGVKDSGRLIPGHGGLLDRLDGFVAAVMLAAIIGVVRGGSDGAGRGLMVW